MLRRAAILLAAATLPFAAGPASASCLDDLLANDPLGSDAPWQPSPYYNNLGYVHEGPGTIVIESGALVYDVGNLQRYETGRVTHNASAVLAFADCVAG